MRRPVGTVTIRYFEGGGRHRTLSELIEHTQIALRDGAGAGPMRYDSFEVIAATLDVEQ